MFTIFSQRVYKFIAVFLLLNIALQLLSPLQSFALTSGPSQPEVQSFEPVGTTEMVDLFTGDFTYNVPLFELPGPNGGYPFNLHYNSGITMDQESSWVGLGWNLNPGAINRQMRGLPDDFKSDQVTRELDMLPNETYGAGYGAGVELFGADGALGSLSLGKTTYYNNYKGVGYTIDAGISIHTCGTGVDGGMGLNLSLDSQEGIGVNASLSLISHGYYNDASYTMGIGYQSRRGLTGISQGFSSSGNGQFRLGSTLRRWLVKSQGHFGGTSTMSFASQAYSPQVSMPMRGNNVSMTYKTGVAAFGVFGNVYVHGYYNTQNIKDKILNSGAYGYMYLENATQNDLMDFNREKDGLVRKNSPNLPIPSTTYDAYSVTGQGIGGMYRPYRSEIGTLYDQEMKSETFGASGGYDAGFGHFGANLTVNYSINKSGRWEGENDIASVYKFENAKTSIGKTYEPYYFKTYGEHTSDHLQELAYVGDSLPVRIKVESAGSEWDPKYTARPILESKKKNVTISSLKNINDTTLEKREPRNLVVQPITNTDLIDEGTGDEILKEYKVYYYKTPSSGDYKGNQKDSLRRALKQPHHVGGITAVNPDGTRYVYGLPAYNNRQVECQFSVPPLTDKCTSTLPIAKNANGTRPIYKINGTEQYFNRTNIPGYAHSYMITAILGADYIDADKIPGPSTGDIGYWVRFNYVKTSSSYKWKVPFNGANYMKGYNNNTYLADDKGAYVYGEKEVWHLATVETKSHIATFNISQRFDAKGVSTELQNIADPLGDASYKLDSISLYSRSEYERSGGIADKKVHFRYSYDLCKNVPNNSGAYPEFNAKGKLTLKKVWFTDGNNNRGALSPYVFNYNENNNLENPDYHTHKYDRWGNYKPYSATGDAACQSVELPYVGQFDPSNPNFKSDLDRNMAVWNLKSITLPSGGTIDIKYESDDYGYVQNKTAMQMMKIASLSGTVNDSTINHIADAPGSSRRIYFNLEKPIPSSLDTATQKKEVKKYLDETGKIYFKLFINLFTANNPSKAKKEYVSGYADVADCGIDNGSLSGSNYTRAYIELGKMKIGGKTMKYHPFSIAAWQHLRTNQPDLNNAGGYTKSNGSKSEAVKGIIKIQDEVYKMFRGYYKYCYDNNYGKVLDLKKSFIRLNSPDKIKYGGGVRVKEIVMRDNWSTVSGDQNIGGAYGQVFDYTTQENGQTISSGVAAYEPLIGGDEIALRSAKGFTEEIPLMTPNNLYFELPVNENYYPGPMVGYSKVTVKSIATHYAPKTGSSDPYNIPSQANTTGQTIHEFYTAKDFPVITEETLISKYPFDLFIPIPLLGQVTVNNLTASQGYSIQLNDMHGKLKMVSHYRQDKNGAIDPEPISWVKYNYQCSPVMKGRGDRSTDYFALNNKVNTLISDRNGITTTSVRFIGQDYEFFTDMREGRTFSMMGGVSLNSDFVLFGIPVLMPWPNIGTSTTQVRTAATNKIIHKSGILISTEAYDGGSLVKTENVLFDALTGQPVLTKVTNDYDDPVYNYNLPGHLVYDNMGPAYKNIGIRFTATLSTTATAYYYNIPASSAPSGELTEGDEFVVGNRKAIFTRRNGSNLEFFIEATGFTGSKEFVLTRSGKRNHLTSNVMNITALSDPTKNRVPGNCNVTVKVPKVMKVPVITLAACAQSQTNLISAYIRSSSYPNPVKIHSSPWNAIGGVCGDIVEAGPTYYYDYISSPGTGQICKSSLAGCTGFRVDYFYFYDANGSLINLGTVDSLKNPIIATTYPNTISTSQPYQQVSLDVIYKNNGGRTKAYAFGSATWDKVTQTYYRDSIILADTVISISKYALNNILNATAVTMSDSWGLDNSLLRDSLYWTATNRDIFAAKSGYIKGSDGTWRQEETYVYSDNRKQSATVNTRKDGIFDNFSLFNFTNPSLSDCSPRWRKVNTVSDYNLFSSESENKDIQGIYSGALYGYKGGDLVTAIAANARTSEIAFESFEEFTPGQPINIQNYGTGNFLFFTSSPGAAINTYDSYKIISGNNNLLIVDKPWFQETAALSAEVDGTIYSPASQAGKKIKGTYTVTMQQSDGTGKNTLLQLDPSAFNLGNIKWTGKAKLKYSVSQKPVYTSLGSGNNQPVIVSGVAHSGKNSIRVTGLNYVEQRKLNLLPGKKYTFSCWVSNNNNNAATFGGSQYYTGLFASIYFKDINGNDISPTTTFYPSGSIVGLWQKVEGEFTVPTGAVSIIVGLSGGANPGAALTGYFDDIRIYPSNASMETYVYSKTDYKLKAKLDQNNYATFYHYDAAGNLYLLEKETEKGIQSIQEVTGHQSEN